MFVVDRHERRKYNHFLTLCSRIGLKSAEKLRILCADGSRMGTITTPRVANGLAAVEHPTPTPTPRFDTPEVVEMSTNKNESITISFRNLCPPSQTTSPRSQKPSPSSQF
jgi:hypothetical protein